MSYITDHVEAMSRSSSCSRLRRLCVAVDVPQQRRRPSRRQPGRVQRRVTARHGQASVERGGLAAVELLPLAVHVLPVELAR